MNSSFKRSPASAPKQIDTALFFAAASAAYRQAGYTYVKSGSMTADQEGNLTPATSNKERLLQCLEDPTAILDEDRQHAAMVRRHYQGLSFKILSGKVLGEIDAKALAYASGDTVSQREAGIISYLPEGYERAQARKSIEDRVNDAAGGLIGSVGSKVTAKIEVLKTVFSQYWGVFFVTAITDQDQAVFFAHKMDLPAGSKMTISATVKAHKGNQTQLNRAKILAK